MMNSGTDPNLKKALEPQPAADSTPKMAANVQPQGEGGQMPDPKPEKALGPEQDALQAAGERVVESTTAWVIEHNVAEFRKEFQRLDRGYRDHENNYPIWKIMRGGDEARFVDRAIEAQREREYEKPHAVVCGEDEFELLCVARDLLEANRGHITPAEDFISTVLGMARRHPLTPSRVDMAVKTLHDDFETAQETAEFFLRQYPDLVTTTPSQQPSDAPDA